jgi:hypothetical protein
MYSRFIENHLIWILEDGPLISEVVLSQRQINSNGSGSSSSNDAHDIFFFLETSPFIGHTKPMKNMELSSTPTKNTELLSKNFCLGTEDNEKLTKKPFPVGFGLSSVNDENCLVYCSGITIMIG